MAIICGHVVHLFIFTSRDLTRSEPLRADTVNVQKKKKGLRTKTVLRRAAIFTVTYYYSPSEFITLADPATVVFPIKSFYKLYPFGDGGAKRTRE